MNAAEALKKYWWVGAVGVAAIVLLRGRAAAPAAPLARLGAIEGAAPTPDGVMAQTLQRLSLEEAQRASKVGEAQTALALQGIKSQQQLLGLQTQYASEALKGQTAVQARLTERAKSMQFQCPPGQGVPRIDPSTGQVFCRKKAGGGLTLGNIFKGVVGSEGQNIGKIIPGIGNIQPPVIVF